MSIFEKGTREKVRFPSTKGELTIEDLWDLLPSKLDVMYLAIEEELQKIQGTSLRRSGRNNKAADVLTLKLDIIQHIINVKDDEANRKQRLAELATQRDKAKEIKEYRKQQALASMSDEELEAYLAQLEAEMTS